MKYLPIAVQKDRGLWERDWERGLETGLDQCEISAIFPKSPRYLKQRLPTRRRSLCVSCIVQSLSQSIVYPISCLHCLFVCLLFFSRALCENQRLNDTQLTRMARTRVQTLILRACGNFPSSETQGQIVGARKSLNGGKIWHEEK